MTKTIWKYPLELDGEQRIEMPAGARVLTVQMQGAQPCLWALVEPGAPQATRRFRMIGTGHPITGDPGIYVGTFQLPPIGLVFHVFEAAS